MKVGVAGFARLALLAIPRPSALVAVSFTVLAQCPIPSALAYVFTDVTAEINSGVVIPAVQADNAGNTSPPEKSVHGIAAATTGGSSAFADPGAASPCAFMPGVPGCGYELPVARAVGEVRGDLGRLRLQSLASADIQAGIGAPFSSVTVKLADTLRTTSAGDVTFRLHLGVDVIEAAVQPDLVLTDLFELRFFAGASGILLLPEFVYTTPGQTDSRILIDETFVLPGLPADATVGFNLQMRAETECSVNINVTGGNTCSAFIDAGNSAFLGIDGSVVSDSGYSYPGFSPAPVPEPATWAMLLTGLLAVAARARTLRHPRARKPPTTRLSISEACVFGTSRRQRSR